MDGNTMVDVFGIEIGIFSLFPASFGAILSVYNWYKMNKPADIHPSKIINYGLITSQYEGAMLFCFPLILNNDGAKKGMVTDIKIGFKIDNELKYLTLDGKARLEELDSTMAPLMDWQKFQKEGYVILQPTYPIVVEAGGSTDVVIMATVDLEEKIVPVNASSECVIEVEFGNQKRNQIKFPFFLSQEDAEIDDRLAWLSPISRKL